MLRPCFHKTIVFWTPFSVLCTGHTHQGKKTVECPSQEHPLKSSTFHFTSHSSTPLNFAIVPEGKLCVNEVIGRDWYINGSPLYWKIDIFYWVRECMDAKLPSYIHAQFKLRVLYYPGA